MHMGEGAQTGAAARGKIGMTPSLCNSLAAEPAWTTDLLTSFIVICALGSACR